MEYPILAGKASKWTPEYRKQWNKEYRSKIKAGEITPNKRVEESRWDDPEFRRSYDVSRSTKLAEEKLKTKLSFDIDSNVKRPNYSKAEKEELLKKWVEMLKNGQEVDHPFLTLSLEYKPQYKREYNKK
jgi:hypothetical protein